MQNRHENPEQKAKSYCRTGRSPRRREQKHMWLAVVVLGVGILGLTVVFISVDSTSRQKRQRPVAKTSYMEMKICPVAAEDVPKSTPEQIIPKNVESKDAPKPESLPEPLLQDTKPKIFIVHCSDIEYVFVEGQFCPECSRRFQIQGQRPRGQDKNVEILTAICTNCGIEREFHFDVSSFADNPQQAKSFVDTWKIFNSGAKAYDREEIENAEKAMLDVAGREPSYAPAYLYLARISTKKNKPEEAVFWAQKANELQPNDPECHRIMADAYEKMGNRRDAKINREIAVNLLEKQKRLGNSEMVDDNAVSEPIYIHPDTGLSFPSVVAGLDRYRVEELWGETVIKYNKSETYLAVHLYAAPGIEAPRARGDLPHAFRQNYSKCKARILLELEVGGDGTYYRFISENRLQFLPEQNGPVAMRASFRGKSHGVEHGQELYLCVVKGYYLEMRGNYHLSEECALDDIGQFMEGLLGKSQSVDNNGKQAILSIIEKFRKNHEDQDCARAILEFASESKDVVISITPELMRWTGMESQDKNAVLLNTAYLAGNVRAQLLNGLCRDDPHAGLLMVFEIYKKLKTNDNGYKNPEIEKLLKLEKKGKLKEYLSNILPK